MAHKGFAFPSLSIDVEDADENDEGKIQVELEDDLPQEDSPTQDEEDILDVPQFQPPPFIKGKNLRPCAMKGKFGLSLGGVAETEEADRI